MVCCLTAQDLAARRMHCCMIHPVLHPSSHTTTLYDTATITIYDFLYTRCAQAYVQWSQTATRLLPIDVSPELSADTIDVLPELNPNIRL
jgi:hypothetical protein